MRLPDAWSSGSGRRIETEPGVLKVSPKLGYVLTRRFASFLPPTQLPTLSSFLALNIVSALDLDCIINGQSLESAAFGCWLCIKLLTQ